MGKPNKLWAFLRDVDLYLACLALGMLIVVTVSGVFARYLINRPFGWMEEVQLWCFLWTVFLGAGAVARHGGHIAIDAFIGLFPRILRRFARFICQMVIVAVVGFLGYYAWSLVEQMHRTERVTNILSVPYYIIYAVVPLACLIMILVALYNAVMIVLAALGIVRPHEEMNAVEAAIKEVENV